ncbi:MAG TPA: hypothetical protein VHL10_01075, partial [Nitrososphaera sp.]|nr:hypothetical protein [Nitrososphaera sp.]
MPLFDPYQDQTASLQLPQMPVTPAPKKGLFSSIGNLLAKADTVDDNGLTFWDRLGNVSASLRDDPAYRQMAYEQNAAKSQAYKKDALQKQALEQANAQADGLGLTGRERLLFMISP